MQGYDSARAKSVVRDTCRRTTSVTAKRLMDVVLSLLLLGLAAPLLVGMSLAICLDSPGPIFFRQLRAGKAGKAFRIWKFRTMVVEAERLGAGPLIERDDSRITRVGKWLRRLSIDELPQLFNVLRGEMSLVGPRPGMCFQAAQYDTFQRRRLAMPPGITGWAQVHGRNELSWPERIRYDVWYVDHWLLWLDLAIFWLTARVVLRGTGMYTDDLTKFQVRPSRERVSGSIPYARGQSKGEPREDAGEDLLGGSI